MPSVTSVERMSRAEGLEQGRVEGKRLAIREIVRARFGGVPDGLDARLASIDEADLDGMIRRVDTVASAADL